MHITRCELTSCGLDLVVWAYLGQIDGCDVTALYTTEGDLCHAKMDWHDVEISADGMSHILLNTDHIADTPAIDCMFLRTALPVIDQLITLAQEYDEIAIPLEMIEQLEASRATRRAERARNRIAGYAVHRLDDYGAGDTDVN